MLGIQEIPTRTLLVAKVATRACGIPIESVVEVMRPLPIEVVDGAAEGVIGMSIIRGEPMPVVDLGALVGVACEQHTRLVVVRTGTRRVALRVDAIIGVRRIAEHDLGDVPPLFRGERHAAIAAVGRLDADLLVVLSRALELP